MDSQSDNSKPSLFRELIGNKITSTVIWGTIIMGGLAIIFAAIALFADDTKAKAAFTIIQYTFGALLPLWGTWIGTILAYYYSKENFESANKSVQQLVDKITSDKKLESVKAKDVMIPKEKLIFQRLQTGEDLSKFKLKEDCIDFMQSNKIRRLIILTEKDYALYVLHRDLVSFFISTETLAGNPIANYTLKDMYNKANSDLKFTMDNSVKFINKDANLLEAKNLMSQYKTCLDVFLTDTGKPDEPILGWITNVTISDNSVV